MIWFLSVAGRMTVCSVYRHTTELLRSRDTDCCSCIERAERDRVYSYDGGLVIPCDGVSIARTGRLREDEQSHCITLHLQHTYIDILSKIVTSLSRTKLPCSAEHA